MYLLKKKKKRNHLNFVKWRDEARRDVFCISNDEIKVIFWEVRKDKQRSTTYIYKRIKFFQMLRSDKAHENCHLQNLRS